VTHMPPAELRQPVCLYTTERREMSFVTTSRVHGIRLRGGVLKTSTHMKGKVKFSLYKPWRPFGLREVEARTFSDIRLIDGGKIVSPTRRPLFTTRKIPGTHFC
jgi:hypothetical protein